MSAGIVSATIRVTVTGEAGRADLAVPLWVDVASLAGGYAELLGLAEAPVLATSSGAVLDTATSVADAGLRHGDLLVALRPDADPVARRPLPEPRPGTAPTHRRPVLLGLSALAALGSAGVLAVSDGSAVARPLCLALLLVCALVAVAPTGGPADRTARARTAVAPAFAGAAGFGATYTGTPGGLYLGLSVGALAAAVVAAVGRAFLDDEHDELVDVWLVVAGAVAVLSTGLLLLGAPTQTLGAVLFAAAVVGARLLPYTVVDVPDEALLDLDRLAVTAWSARERPRGSRRRRSIVRFDGVSAVVRRGQRLVTAGTVVIAVVVATAGPWLVLGAGRDLQGYGAWAMVGLGGVALALVARSFRSPLPRHALRLSALWVLAVLGAVVLDGLAPTVLLGVFGGTALLGLLVAVSAVALGRGWRSVWWARVADLAEGAAVVLVVAAVPLASGLFDVVSGFTA